MPQVDWLPCVGYLSPMDLGKWNALSLQGYLNMEEEYPRYEPLELTTLVQLMAWKPFGTNPLAEAVMALFIIHVLQFSDFPFMLPSKLSKTVRTNPQCCSYDVQCKWHYSGETSQPCPIYCSPYACHVMALSYGWMFYGWFDDLTLGSADYLLGQVTICSCRQD